ncbi:MAG: DsbA family protein [Candidatus Pseudothioglobus sp.]
MKLATNTLYYIHDPMCSWCWAFSPTWTKVREALPIQISINYLLGGLAPDSKTIMPTETREYVKGNWKRIQEVIPGTKFNYDFWILCEPKRSTYPSCRAVICAKNQRPEIEQSMINAIQQAYYLNAQNPSNEDVLIKIANDLGLDTERFKKDLRSTKVNETLLNEINLAQSISNKGFPSLVLNTDDKLKKINIDYLDANYIINQIIS